MYFLKQVQDRQTDRLTDIFNLIRSDQGGSQNLFSDMQILIHLLMLRLFLMISSNLVHTKVQTTKLTTFYDSLDLKINVKKLK